MFTLRPLTRWHLRLYVCPMSLIGLPDVHREDIINACSNERACQCHQGVVGMLGQRELARPRWKHRADGSSTQRLVLTVTMQTIVTMACAGCCTVIGPSTIADILATILEGAYINVLSCRCETVDSLVLSSFPFKFLVRCTHLLYRRDAYL